MTPRLHPIQAAWLAEIGVDLHWLGIRPVPGAARRPAPSAKDQPAGEDRGVSLHPGKPSAAAAPLPGAVGVRPGADAGRADQDAARDTGVQLDAATDLAGLAAAVQVCRRCIRHEQRIRAVPGAGSASRPQYLIVGEQPGIEDEVSGLPFQGDAGRLLDAMLAAARLPLAQSVHHTYAVKCRAALGREPDAAEVAACLPYLRQEIALLRPRWILALGRVAGQAVLGVQSDLDALRGGPHRYSLDTGETIPVWVTHQPASLLVRSALKAEAWRDLVGLTRAVRAAPADDVD